MEPKAVIVWEINENDGSYDVGVEGPMALSKARERFTELNPSNSMTFYLAQVIETKKE